MNPREKALERLAERYDRVESRSGGFLGGQAHFKGLIASRDIAGRMGTVETLLYGLLDGPPPAKAIELYEILVGVNVYPDPRIWAMRAGAYAAASRSPYSAGFAAASMAMHSKIYGMQPAIACARFAIGALGRVRSGERLEGLLAAMLEAGETVPGFGRPVSRGEDERTGRVLELMESGGHPVGPHLGLMLDAARFLKAAKGLHMNYAGLFPPVLLDPPFGLSLPRLTLATQLIATLPVMFAVLDCEERREEYHPLLPLKVEDLGYSGPAPRSLPGRPA